MTNLERNISKIIGEVRKKGDSAIAAYNLKFDGEKLAPADFLLTGKEIDASVSGLDNSLKTAINQAAKNIGFFHNQELKRISRSWSYSKGGKTVGQMLKPVENICLYVAGGKYAYYPSIVLMSAIPARIAGVKNIYMATPPGNIIPSVLYAAKLAGIKSIYRVGGPMAIAGFAFGTKTL